VERRVSSPGHAGALDLLVAADGSVWVDVGSRFVDVGQDELEQILDRLAADRGALRILSDPGRADDGDEPASRDADTGASALAALLAMAEERGLAASVELAPDDLTGWD
jgi:hypothetical protein